MEWKPNEKERSIKGLFVSDEKTGKTTMAEHWFLLSLSEDHARRAGGLPFLTLINQCGRDQEILALVR